MSNFRKQSKPPGLPKASKKPTISQPEPTHFRSIGKVIKLHSDGTQELELHKPPHGPFGFYIAKGNARYNYGKNPYQKFIANIYETRQFLSY